MFIKDQCIKERKLVTETYELSKIGTMMIAEWSNERGQ
jgi:hypothetical protein